MSMHEIMLWLHWNVCKIVCLTHKKYRNHFKKKSFGKIFASGSKTLDPFHWLQIEFDLFDATSIDIRKH